MAAFSFVTGIGDYVKGKIWDITQANRNKNNTYFNNEVLGQWHDVDNTAVGNQAGQGLSKQLRSVDKACGANLPADTYGGHVLSFSYERATDTVNSESYLLDTSIDWRNRIMRVHSVATKVNGNPTESGDELSGAGARISTAGGSFSLESTNIEAIGSMFSMTYTESGSAFDTAVTNMNRAALVNISPNIVNVTLHAASNAGTSINGETIAIGDLLLTLNADGGGPDTMYGYGIIEVSPAFV